MPVLFDRLAEGLRSDIPIAVATLVRPLPRAGAKVLVYSDGTHVGTMGDVALDRQVVADAVALLGTGSSASRTYPAGRTEEEEIEIFVESHTPLPRLLILGSVHAGPALCMLGARVGYRVTVIDARATYTTRDRFPDASKVIVAWPNLALETLPPLDASTYVAVLTHDPKFEEPLLPILLRSDARYIGLIGSRRTQQQRRATLRQQGFTEGEIARLRGPIGLDIGAVTPEEIAIAILAEMTMVKYEASGRPLKDLLSASVPLPPALAS